MLSGRNPQLQGLRERSHSQRRDFVHTHPHSDHMKLERRYAAAESMIKVLSVAGANFGHLLVNLSGCHVPHCARGS
jgi:hypothetical protein